MSLNPRAVLGSVDLTDYPYMLAESQADVGAPTNVYEAIASQLRDGTIVSSRSTDNRTVVVPLYVEGSDLAAMTDAETALVIECDKASNTLMLDPGDGFQMPAVYEVFRGQVRQVPLAGGEAALLRQYEVEFQALPFPRSLTKTVESAAAAPSSGTVQDACESTTGWSNTGVGAAAPSVDSVIFAEGTGSIKLESGPITVTSTFVGQGNFDKVSQALTTATKTVSIATGPGGYLSTLVEFDWNYSLPPSLEIRMTTSAAASARVSFVASEVVAAGFVRYSWQVPPSVTVTQLDFSGLQLHVDAQTVRPFMRVDSITLATSATTASRISKIITVGGSARTPGSMHISSPSDSVGLGNVLVATVAKSDIRDGFQPDTRRFVTQGTTTADATALSGSYFTLSSSYSSGAGFPIFDVPVAILAPGTYQAVALVKASGAGIVAGVQAQLRIGGTNVGPLSTAEVSTPNPTTNTWRLIPLGSLTLPPLGIDNPDSTAVVRLVFKGGGTLMADLFLIPSTADFTIADLGTGTASATGSSSHLWIDSPTLGNPLGVWSRGALASRANARGLNMTALKKPGRHFFTPGDMAAFLVSTGAAGPNLSLEYYKSWHTNAGE